MLYAPQTPRPLGPNAAEDLDAYRRWARWHEAWRLCVEPPPGVGPEITFVTFVEGAAPTSVEVLARSLGHQTSERWQLVIAVSGKPPSELDAILAATLGTGQHAGAPHRVRVEVAPKGATLHDACQRALLGTTTPAFCFMDPADELAPDAVAQLSSALVAADVAYADEDVRGPSGLHRTPALKPDWSPELLLSRPYLGRPVAMGVAPALAAGGIRAVESGDWEHDLFLRVTERAAGISHVAAVLCHRAADVRPSPLGPGAVVAALRRRHEVADVQPGRLASTWSVLRHPPTVPVSVIVPFRDGAQRLRACADSLLTASGVSDLELVLVDNGSTEPETVTLLERLSCDERVTVLHDDRAFNWAALNNAAAARARGDVLVFVNDDVVASDPGWLAPLVAHAHRREVGAVGARLVYADGTLQHAGVVLGLVAVSGHVLAGLEEDRAGYLGMDLTTRDVSAVTGACLATSRHAFGALGGFDEALGLDFNDVDYCLRARKHHLRVVYEPRSQLVHHESASRGTSGSEETAQLFCERWRDQLAQGDPYLNAHLSRSDLSCSIEDPGSTAERIAHALEATASERALERTPVSVS